MVISTHAAIRNYLVIGVSACVILVSALVGHFLAPWGIIISPFVIAATTMLITFGLKDVAILPTSVICYLYIGLNDILLKLFSGGNHDSEGLGWINALLFIGLIKCFIILVIGVVQRKKELLSIRVLALVTFILLLAIHLALFADLGLGRYY